MCGVRETKCTECKASLRLVSDPCPDRPPPNSTVKCKNYQVIEKNKAPGKCAGCLNRASELAHSQTTGINGPQSPILNPIKRVATDEKVDSPLSRFKSVLGRQKKTTVKEKYTDAKEDLFSKGIIIGEPPQADEPVSDYKYELFKSAMRKEFQYDFPDTASARTNHTTITRWGELKEACEVDGGARMVERSERYARDKAMRQEERRMTEKRLRKLYDNGVTPEMYGEMLEQRRRERRRRDEEHGREKRWREERRDEYLVREKSDTQDKRGGDSRARGGDVRQRGFVVTGRPPRSQEQHGEVFGHEESQIAHATQESNVDHEKRGPNSQTPNSSRSRTNPTRGHHSGSTNLNTPDSRQQGKLHRSWPTSKASHNSTNDPATRQDRIQSESGKPDQDNQYQGQQNNYKQQQFQDDDYYASSRQADHNPRRDGEHKLNMPRIQTGPASVPVAENPVWRDFERLKINRAQTAPAQRHQDNVGITQRAQDTSYGNYRTTSPTAAHNQDVHSPKSYTSPRVNQIQKPVPDMTYNETPQSRQQQQQHDRQQQQSQSPTIHRHESFRNSSSSSSSSNHKRPGKKFGDLVLEACPELGGAGRDDDGKRRQLSPPPPPTIQEQGNEQKTFAQLSEEYLRDVKAKGGGKGRGRYS